MKQMTGVKRNKTDLSSCAAKAHFELYALLKSLNASHELKSISVPCRLNLESPYRRVP